MKKMNENHAEPPAQKARNGPSSSNVKSPQKPSRYERFGETVRYLTIEELQQFFDTIDNYRHKLMMRMIYELGCRVGEFVRIQLKHISFSRNTVCFPAENTKTRRRRVSHLPAGLMNEIKSLLRQDGRMAKRADAIRSPDQFLFYPGKQRRRHYTENRLRQIFRNYARKAGLAREYGRDSKNRVLHELTIHSLRHSHIMHYVHAHRLPLPVVQRQVGHKTLKTTSIYLRPSDEHVAQAYAEVRVNQMKIAPKSLNTHNPLSFQNDTRT